MKKKLCLCVAGTILVFCTAMAESHGDKSVRPGIVPQEVSDSTSISLLYNAEAGAILKSGSFVPTAITNNKHGIVSPTNSGAFARAAVLFNAKSKYGLYADVGADIVAFMSGANLYYDDHYHLQQLYIDAGYKKLGISYGKKEEKPMLVDYDMSSGNMVWSENSRPMQRFKIGTNDYVSFAKNWLNVYADMSFGIQGDGDYNDKTFSTFKEITDKQYHYSRSVRDTYFHRLNFFLKSNPNAPFVLTLGAEHVSQYAGIIDGQEIRPTFKNIFNAVACKASGGDGMNCHIGSIDFRGDVNMKDWNLGLYYQMYFEDIPVEGPFRQNGTDGLWGIEYKSKHNWWVDGALFEYIQTSNQGGVVYTPEDYKYGHLPHKYSMTNYYNDQTYGPWANYGLANGNPLLCSPIYNSDKAPLFLSTLQKSLHFCVTGTIFDNLRYRLKYTNTKTWGEPFSLLPETRSNNSVCLDLNYRYRTFTFNMTAALDNGTIYGNNSGILLSVRKTGYIFKMK